MLRHTYMIGDDRYRMAVPLHEYTKLLTPSERFGLVCNIVDDGDISLKQGKELLRRDGPKALKKLVEYLAL